MVGDKMASKNGNVLMISLIMIAIAITIFLFFFFFFMSHINSILYRVKLDMYSMNRSAIVAVNKNKASVDDFSYDTKTYYQEFISLLKRNYDLDNELKNQQKLISSIEVKEYEIYEAQRKDNFSGSRSDNRVIHTVLKVKIKPIILSDFLENIFTFDAHEDVNLNMYDGK